MVNKSIPTRELDYASWYNEIVKKAELAESGAVRGFMIIKPYGFAIWEKMQQILDNMFKATGHSNAYFPLLIPKSFLNKEAAHVEGFAKECAVVTHYRLKSNPSDKKLSVDPDAKLEEELIVRPTSETVIWNTYKKWIQSYRDLPLLINQWANVVRWEMRTRFFLRTTEFLWQEGHTAHATQKEAEDETIKMLEVYENFLENYLAIPVIKGIKTENERFAGAVDTYCVEAMMQDGKALQAGTSHFLGQNFSKVFDVKYASKEGLETFVWGTSWGVSTRLMGALIMAHSDDNGLILPPKLAPIQVVIIPIFKSEEELNHINKVVNKLLKEFQNQGIAVKYDDRITHRPGWKFAEYEMKGIPVRMVIGPKDLENAKVEVVRRDTGVKQYFPLQTSVEEIIQLIEKIQKNLFDIAQKFRKEHTFEVDTYTDFKTYIQKGFVLAHWDGTPETEEKIKEETKATIRCLPLNQKKEHGKCIYSQNPSSQRVLFAKAY